MRLKTALQRKLSSSNEKIFDLNEIEYHVIDLYNSKSFQGKPISVSKRWPEPADVYRYINQLINDGFLHPAESSKKNNHLFFIVGSDPTPYELICYKQPVYISFLSAMVLHGITDRRSNTIWATKSSSTEFYQQTKSVMHLQRLAEITGLTLEYLHTQIINMHNTPLLTRVNKRPLRYVTSKKFNPDFYTSTGGYNLATIGKTFLDMVDHPDFCGGIDHVIQCYENHGKNYSSQIINTANQFASKISKCRIGYLLEEMCGIENNKTLNKWAHEDAQRGGTRKLYAANNYSPNYSERWCISINIE